MFRLALMGDDPFDSAWLKWAMAVVNADVLQDNINELAGKGELQMRIGMAQEYDAKRHCIILTATEVISPFPVMWGLLLGDMVHDYRSSLDHIAWALYKRGRTPNLTESKERLVLFPIADDRTKFNDSLTRKLPGVRRADIAIVRRYQPYKSGKRKLHLHVLKVLDGLSTADKHRVIQPVQPAPETAGYRLIQQTDCVATRLGPRRARRVTLKPGTELARVYVRKTGPNPEIDVEPHFTLDPAINERLTFQDWAVHTMKITSLLLREFAKPPESVHTMLAGTAHGPNPDFLSLEGAVPT
jgi:hypothetical protein